MRQAQFDIAIGSVPKHYAVFRVTSVPKYIRYGLEVGEIVWWNEHRTCMIKVKTGMSVVLACSFLEFVSYQTANEMEDFL